MKLIVQKYGGTSVGTVERIKGCSIKNKAICRKWFSVVVVVSAMGKTTDQLIDLQNRITQNSG
jgi:aspartate kinase